MERKKYIKSFLSIALALILSLTASLDSMSYFVFADEEEPEFAYAKINGSDDLISPEVIEENTCYLIKCPFGTTKVKCFLNPDSYGDEVEQITAWNPDESEAEDIDVSDSLEDGWYEIDLTSGWFDVKEDRYLFFDVYDYIDFDESSLYYAFQSQSGEWVVIQVGGGGDPLPLYLTNPEGKIDKVLEYDQPIKRSFRTGQNNTFIESDQIVYYTTDGSDPKESATAIEIEQGVEISIGKNTTVKARTKAGDTWGELCEYNVKIRPKTPKTSLKSGNYIGEQTVELSCLTKDSKIYYTTDGTDPDDSATLYNNEEPVVISTDTTIKAIAYKDDMSPSEITTATYNFKAGLSVELKDNSQASWYCKQQFAIERSTALIAPYGTNSCDLIATIPDSASITVNDKPITEKNSDGKYEFTLEAKLVENVTNNENLVKNVIDVTDGDINVSYSIYCMQAEVTGLPDKVIDYFCVGSQYTNTIGGFGGNVEKTLLGEAAVMNCTSMGNYGGYAVWWYKDGITNNPNNPYGVDFVVIGNSFDGTTEAAEPGNVLVSEDGEKWYTLAGSIHYDDNVIWNQKVTYRKSATAPGFTDYELDGEPVATWDRYAYPLKNAYPEHINQDHDFTEFTTYGTYIKPQDNTNQYGNVMPAYPAFGFADVGYCNSASNKAENPYGGLFKGGMVGHSYTYRTLTNRNGDGFDLEWAVDENGEPKKLDKIHFVKVQTASGILNGAIGEKSTEVCCIRTAEPDESSVGVTEAPSSIEFDGVEIPGSSLESGKIKTVNVEGIFDVKVNAEKGSNVYINSIKNDVAYMDKAPKDIVRIIVQKGKKAPVIYYFRINQSKQTDTKKVTKVLFDANDGMMFDKEKYVCYYDEDTLQHRGENKTLIPFDDPTPQNNTLAFYGWFDSSNNEDSYTEVSEDFLAKFDEITLSAKYAKIEDAKAAKAVTATILALKDKQDLSEEDEEAVVNARNEYDKLTYKQQVLVGGKVYNKLLEAEVVIGALDAYRLMSAIDALPDVDDITLKDEEKILDAAATYNALSKDMKKEVTNYAKLLEVELRLAELKLEASEQKLENANEDIGTKQDKIDKLINETIPALTKQLNDKIAELEKAEKEDIPALKTEIAGLEQRLAKADSDLEKANAEIADLRKELVDNTVKDLIASTEKMLTSIEENLKEAGDSISTKTIKALVDTAEKVLDAAKAKVDETNKVLAELQKVRDELKQAREQAEKDIAAAEQARDQALKDKDQALKDKEQALKDKEQAEKDRDAAVEAASEISKKLISLQNKIAASNLNVKGFKVSCKSGKFTLTWTENTEADGYKVQYRKKGAKKYKTLKVTTKTKVTKKNLKVGKEYQFRVRTYKKVDEKKVYGKWTKAKTVQCK